MFRLEKRRLQGDFTAKGSSRKAGERLFTRHVAIGPRGNCFKRLRGLRNKIFTQRFEVGC